jgi:hypothetical protein
MSPPVRVTASVAVDGDVVNRAAVVYLVMVLVLVGGLWAVLAIGAGLEPPQDLAGKWQLSAGTPPNGLPNSLSAWGPEMQIEQSGRFFQIFTEHGPKLDLKLTEDDGKRVVLDGTRYKLTFSGPNQDEKRLLVEGPQGGDWTARRVTRKYPSDVQPRPTTKPVAATQAALTLGGR